MADESDHGDTFHGSTEELVAEIRKMEREKEELERRNRERQQLEKQLRQLKRNVSSSKTGNSGGAGKGEKRKSQEAVGISAELSASLEQSQSTLRDLHQSLFSSPTQRERSSGDLSESFEEFDDDVMTAEHKQALRENRDILVENMTPDDIFNDLISKHILSSADVSRIKEKNTSEAMNEELLNVVVRRSDRAFYVFVSALRKTLQGWLANRLDPSNTQQRMKRKRGRGELNVDIDCERVNPIASKEKYTCTCQEVEKQILVMAKGAFSHIRRRDASASSFEQFKKELQQTNQVIKDSLDLMNSLKILCRHGDVIDLSEGSVRFTVRCRSFRSCKRLWREYESGELLAVFQKGLVTPSLLTVCGAKSISIHVRISKLEYITCALELAQRLLVNRRRINTLQRQGRPLRSNRGVCEENKSGNVSLCHEIASSPPSRRAFQEIPNNVISRQTLDLYPTTFTREAALDGSRTTSQITFNENTRTSSCEFYFREKKSSNLQSSTSLEFSSIWGKNQWSPIHKTRSIMRQRKKRDSENFDLSHMSNVKTFKSTLKLYRYNLRTRPSDERGRVLQGICHV